MTIREYNRMDDLEEIIKNENAWTREKNELITLVVVFFLIGITMIIEYYPSYFCGSPTSNCLSRAGAVLVMFALFGGATSYYIQSREKIATNTFLYSKTLPNKPEDLLKRVELPENFEATSEVAYSVLDLKDQLDHYKLREILAARMFATDFTKIQFMVAAFGTFVWGFGDLYFAKVVCFIILIAIETRMIFICWISRARDIDLFPDKVEITSME